jgi:RimJ/RimL family protein N-acetyltransferase
MVHPLAVLLDEAAHGRFPPADGAVRVLPPLPGQLDALVSFTGTFALAGALSQAEVDARAPRGDFSIPMSPAFVHWVADRLGARAATHDVVLVAISSGTTSSSGGRSDLVDTVDVSGHPRVQRALRYRRDVRAYGNPDGSGVVVLGRGITGRWEIAFEVDDGARGSGLGRALAAAGVGLLPEGTPVWAQVAPGNAASLRAVLGAGFRPVGAEILFVRDRG